MAAAAAPAAPLPGPARAPSQGTRPLRPRPAAPVLQAACPGATFVAVYVAALTLDVRLGDVRSLKQKRSVVRPLVADLRRRYPGASVAETGHLDLHRRAEIGVAVVSATAAHAAEVLTECERTVAGHPEVELLSARQRLFSEEE